MPGKLLHDVLLSDFWGYIKMSGSLHEWCLGSDGLKQKNYFMKTGILFRTWRAILLWNTSLGGSGIKIAAKTEA